MATTAAVAAFGSGTAATSLSAAAISGAAGGIAANSAANLLNGKPIGEGTLKAGATAALAAGAGQLLAKGALALKQAWTTARQTAGSINKSAKTTQADAKDLAEGAGAGQLPTTGADSVNAGSALRSKLSALENAQQGAAVTRHMPDGRVRYYGPESTATNPGATRGASYVTEYNPQHGQVRSWMESYNQAGTVNRVHPKMINGQQTQSQHYPPTARELGQ